MKKLDKKEGKTQRLAQLPLEKLTEKDMSSLSGGGTINAI